MSSFSQLQRSRPKVEVDKQEQDVKMSDAGCLDFSKVRDSVEKLVYGLD